MGGLEQNVKSLLTPVSNGVGTCADFPFADRTFADGHLLIRHLLTGPRHLLTETFADFSHPCHLLTLEGRLLIQTFADPDNC